MSKRIVITGAAGGIGTATAERLAADGHQLLLLDQAGERLDAVAARIPGSKAYGVDVTDAEATAALMERLWAEGPIDVVMTAAGILRLGTAEQLSVASFEQQMAVNFFGTLHVVQALLPKMKGRGQGHFVLMASMAALRGMAHFSAYAASKFAVLGYAQSLRDELAGTGVAISVICPPSIRTPMVTEQNYLPPIYKRTPWKEPSHVAAGIAKVLTTRRFLVLLDFNSRLMRFLDGVAPWLSDRVILAMNR